MCAAIITSLRPPMVPPMILVDPPPLKPGPLELLARSLMRGSPSAHSPRSPLKTRSSPILPVKRVVELKHHAILGQVFTETYKPLLPLPTSRPGEVISSAAGGSAKVILWRGCRSDQLINMVRTGSAGGRGAPNPDAARPTEQEVIAQVGEFGHLPEFTHSMDVATQFGTGAFVCAFEIEGRYLAMGSGTEGGWICANEAPIKLVGWREGRDFTSHSRKKESADAIAQRKIELITKKNQDLRFAKLVASRIKGSTPKPPPTSPVVTITA